MSGDLLTFESFYVYALSLLFVILQPVKAKIITCPACRLNSLPKVKNFVKEQSQWFTPSLEVEYISGRDPHLFLFEDNKETGDIDLAVRIASVVSYLRCIYSPETDICVPFVFSPFARGRNWTRLL